METKRKIPYKPRKSQKIDIPKALDLRFNHKLSNREIAEYFSCNPGSVSERLKSFVEGLPSVVELQKLDTARSDLLKATMYANLSDLSDPAKRKAASLNNSAYAFAQLHNAVRLEEGKSTANVNLLEYFARVRTAGNPPAGDAGSEAQTTQCSTNDSPVAEAPQSTPEPTPPRALLPASTDATP